MLSSEMIEIAIDNYPKKNIFKNPGYAESTKVISIKTLKYQNFIENIFLDPE
jgi:hypothetical protein